jgi:outer membrane protein TolC
MHSRSRADAPCHGRADHSPGRSSFALKLAMLLSAVSLAGCASFAPQPFSEKELKEQARLDAIAARQDVAAITGPLTLEEAIARALKYNLDRRTHMMEEAVALNQADVGNYDMLPKLIASAGYHDRSEYATTRAVDSVTGEPSLANPFISSAKEHTVSDLGMTWSILDFGLSYYSAKQNADRVLIAAERRRKAMHTLMQDVRVAFWRAAAAQKLRDAVRQADVMAEGALKDARQAEKESLRSPLDSLRYQRQVLENLRLLEAIEQDLSTAQVELAALINAPLSADLKVVEPAQNFSSRMLDMPVEQMEDAALVQNADLREQNYNARIADQETRKVILRLFPNLSFNYSLTHDSDSFLVHNRWNEAGAMLSFNLFNLLSGPSQYRLAEAGIALADQRRIATQMAVLAQVHIARLHYANALQQYERADAIATVDDRINAHVSNRAQVQTQSELDRVANNTSAILSELRRYQALAEANAAASKLQATLGMEPNLGSVQDLSLTQMQTSVADALQQWNDGKIYLAQPAAAVTDKK